MHIHGLHAKSKKKQKKQQFERILVFIQLFKKSGEIEAQNFKKIHFFLVFFLKI